MGSPEAHVPPSTPSPRHFFFESVSECVLTRAATSHNTAHDAFMTLPPYTGTREDIARLLGSGPNPLPNG